ncbi:hypothetical protein D3C73_1005210 [compost metagenome]|uniref:WapI family immunity protein n=1 Tax=Brevundimonas diminuta TaxID=293 RepID=UPI000F9B4062
MTDTFADYDDKPDLKLGGLSLWAESKERPNDDDDWDGNWLVIRARVDAPGSSVELRGPWLRTDEVASFLTEVETMSRDMHGKATLAPIEPAIKATLEMGSLGQIAVYVEASPNHLEQRHSFNFGCDQSYLPEIIRGCRKILLRFPIKGSRL